jgi:hypothetical protein
LDLKKGSNRRLKKKLHNEELHKVYSQDDETKESGIGGACSTDWRELHTKF